VCQLLGWPPLLAVTAGPGWYESGPASVPRTISDSGIRGLTQAGEGQKVHRVAPPGSWVATA